MTNLTRVFYLLLCSTRSVWFLITVYRKYRKQTLPVTEALKLWAHQGFKQKKTRLYAGSEQIPETLLSVSAAGCGDLE